MMNATTVAAFLGAAAIVIAIPGPSVVFIVSRSLQCGTRAGIVTVFGNTAGVMIQVVAVAAGLGAVIAASATAFTVIKVAGGIYLIFLGVQAIRHRNDAAAGSQGRVTVDRADLRRHAVDAFMVGLLNPKVIVFLAAFLPQFVSPTGGPVWQQMLVLGLLFNALSILMDGTYAVIAGGAREWWIRSPRAMARARTTGGVGMTALGVALLASRRSSA